jgi:hypothetical protein
MAVAELTTHRQSAADQPVVRAVTVIMSTVVGLTFLVGFGNVLTLALRLGVPVWVAPLGAPAVDLSILGLLLGTSHLALRGATLDQLRPARRLLIFASFRWAEVGPGPLQASTTIDFVGVNTIDTDLLPGSGEVGVSTVQPAAAADGISFLRIDSAFVRGHPLPPRSAAAARIR